MADPRLIFPGPGCIVECMQGNKPVPHWVLETQNDSVRLLSPTRRESKLAISRLLPWYGPQYSPDKSREDMERILEEHRAMREKIVPSIDIAEVWELAQGEVEQASANWLAEMLWEVPDIDYIAAMGHAALACKTHFKFSPPEFEIYDAATAARKTAEHAATKEREAVSSVGGEFFRALWAYHAKGRGPLAAEEFPSKELATVLERMLRDRLADPETEADTETWRLLTKSLPEDPHMALHLAVAWGLVKEHHNFWLDRAGYTPDEGWSAPFAAELNAIKDAVHSAAAQETEDFSGLGGRPFLSIDPASTSDVDDAFSLLKNPDGSFHLLLAFACPSRFWPFGNELDKAVLRRASSLYLPEADYHMMPRETALSLFSLLADERRPAAILEATLSPEGEILSLTPQMGWVRLQNNLCLSGVQAILDGANAKVAVTAKQIMEAAPHAAMLKEALELAQALQQRRIAAGAVITERPDPEVTVEYNDAEGCSVSICHAPDTPSAHMIVGEFMILANSWLAAWAKAQGIPLFFRSQDVALPKEFSGVWTEPEDITRVIKHLPPSTLDTTPRPHAGLGAAVYAPLTSPIRRYTDLVNAAQILSFLQTGKPRFTNENMSALLPQMAVFSEQTGQIQRFRPRYWKLLFYKQMGDKIWWDAVVTEENDAFAVLSLPLTQITVRARRKTMGEKVFPGERVKVRLGKIDPLRNEIRVLAVMEQ